ncbi:DUF4258 domain-containing protein [Candidatus Woesearchaeota archaeon]|nr:DUF4258 domain-containing protein [Candidatus Woesearchaeota archaeon]
MDGLGIDKNEVEQAILKGMKWKEENTDKWHAQMSGIEVVFVKQENMFVIVTAYFAGRRK